MRAPRKTDPIDDVINELLKPIKFLRELKKVKLENERLMYNIAEMHKFYARPIELEDQNIKLQESNEYLEKTMVDMIAFYEARNATS